MPSFGDSVDVSGHISALQAEAPGQCVVLGDDVKIPAGLLPEMGGGRECRTFSGLTEAEMASLISEATIGTFFVILAKWNVEDRLFILGSRINDSKILIGVLYGNSPDSAPSGRLNVSGTELTYTTWSGSTLSVNANRFQGVMYPATASKLDMGGGGGPFGEPEML